ncbi:glycosyltransferase [Candidatus Binatia bacterium]|nr:glycosyltransferase [Candidatus Binatia bacterium]
MLLVSDTPFRPTDAGNRARIAGMIEHLRARGWRVSVVLRADRDLYDADLRAMRRAVERLTLALPDGGWVVPRWRPTVRFARHRRQSPPPARSGDEEWCPEWLLRTVATEAARWRPDATLAEYVYLAPVLDAALLPDGTRPLGLIDTHDVMSQRHAAYRQAGVPLQWFHASAEDERRALARADHVLAIHDGDAAALARLVTREKIVVVPHGRSLVAPPPAPCSDLRLVAIASRNDLNVAGLRWFFNEVWPRILRVVPAAELVVCGTACAKLTAPAGVVLRGYVADLASELRRARATICPLGGGTGLKIKIVDSLAHGVPVVTTLAGATGFATGEQHGIVVASNAGEFAAAAVRLLCDADALAAATRGAVTQAASFSSSAAFAPLDTLLAARLARLAPR